MSGVNGNRWRKANPERYREVGRLDNIRRTARKNALKAKLFEKQYGLCLLCGLALPVDLRRISLDHDHSCHSGSRGCPKCWRGLLHQGCNTALGSIEKSPESLLHAIIFLRGLHTKNRTKMEIPDGL